jgi:hypothetical protein
MAIAAERSRAVAISSSCAFETRHVERSSDLPKTCSSVPILPSCTSSTS